MCGELQFGLAVKIGADRFAQGVADAQVFYSARSYISFSRLLDSLYSRFGGVTPMKVNRFGWMKSGAL